MGILRTAPERSFQVLLFFFFLISVLGVYGACLIARRIDGRGDAAHLCLKYWAQANLGIARLKVSVLGLDKVDKKATYVFVANHSSFLDVLLLLAYIPNNFRFIVKQESFRRPMLGSILRGSRQIPVDRKNPKQSVLSLRDAAGMLSQGISIVVFPEGTRTRDGELGDFKTTPFLLPLQTGLPVLPIRIEGTFAALRRGSVLLRTLPVSVAFRDPIQVPSDRHDRATLARLVREALL